MKHLALLTILTSLVLSGCASVRAPEMAGVTWTGMDGRRLSAELRTVSEPLPEGWLLEAPQSSATGSFAYRKRSGTYDFAEVGYFVVHPKWRSDQVYVGLLKQGAIFCVVNPEMQADVTDNTITTYKVYDYCAQLRRQ